MAGITQLVSRGQGGLGVLTGWKRSTSLWVVFAVFAAVLAPSPVAAQVETPNVVSLGTVFSGSIEANESIEYTLDVPETGEYFFETSSCAATNQRPRYTVTGSDNVIAVLDRTCFDNNGSLLELPAGETTIRWADGVGPFAFQVTATEVNTGESVNIDVPTVGRIELPASSVEHELVVPEGGAQYFVHDFDCESFFEWTLTDGEGNATETYSCGNESLVWLAPGVATIQMSSTSTATGDYEFLVSGTSDIDRGEVEIGSATRGTITTALRADVYNLAIPNGGAQYVFDPADCSFSIDLQVVDASGESVYSGPCGEDTAFNLPAGDAWLRIAATRNTTDDYNFRLFEVASEISFDHTFGELLEGTLDPVTQAHVYEIALPETFDSYVLGVADDPFDSCTGIALLVDNSDGDRVAEGSCAEPLLIEDGSGTVSLRVYGSGNYSLSLQGTPEPEVFELGSDGVATGDLVPLATHVYTLNVPTGGATYAFVPPNCVENDSYYGNHGSYYGDPSPEWEIIGSDGTRVLAGECSRYSGSSHILDLSEGASEIRILADDTATGQYSAQLVPIADGVEQALQLGQETSGTLASVNSIDRFSFEVLEDGTEYYFQPNCSGYEVLWSITNGNGAVFSSGSCGTFARDVTLSTGTFFVEITSPSTELDYSFTLAELVPSTFSLPLGELVVGELAEPGIHLYRLDVPVGGAAYDFEAVCPFALEWSTVTSLGETSFPQQCSFSPRLELPEGINYLRFSVVGAYEFQVDLAPEPDSFDLVPGEPVSGQLQDIEARHRYAFDVPAGGATYLFEGLCTTFDPDVVIEDSLGNRNSSSCNRDSRVSLEEGPATLTVESSRQTELAYEFLVSQLERTNFEAEVGVEESGEIEVPGEHLYTLELPIGSDEFSLDLRCTGSPTVDFEIFTDAGSHLASGSCPTTRVIDLFDDVGAVTLMLSSLGQYEFTIDLIPIPEVFEIELGAEVDASFSTVFERHIYEFDAPEFGRYYVAANCIASGPNWDIVNAFGVRAGFGRCGDSEAVTLPAGTATIEVDTYSATGLDYGFTVGRVDPAQFFDLVSGDTYTPEFTTPLAEHFFELEVPPGGGEYDFNFTCTSGTNAGTWTLIPDTGFFNSRRNVPLCTASRGFEEVALDEGLWTLHVVNDTTAPVSYNLDFERTDIRQTDTFVELDPETTPFGASPTATVTVTSTTGEAEVPTGFVQVLAGPRFIGNFDLVDGQATVEITPQAVGVYDVVARYQGDLNYDRSDSDPVVWTVVQGAPPTVTVTAPTAATFNEPVTVSASLAVGDQPVDGGSAELRVDGVVFGVEDVEDGAVEFLAPRLPFGDNQLTVVFTGNDDASPAESEPSSISVSASTPRIVVELAEPSILSGETTTANIVASSIAPSTGQPFGSITLFIDGTEVETVQIEEDEPTTIEVPAQTLGQYELTASFVGTPGWAPASSVVEILTVRTDGTLTIEADPNAPVTGEPVELTATLQTNEVPPTAPTGAVEFFVNDTAVGTADLDGNGVATLSSSALAAGENTVSASYLGDTNVAEINSEDLTILVSPAETETTVAATPNPTALGEETNFEVTVAAIAPGSGSPSGTVTIFADGQPVGSADLVDGSASVSAILDNAGLAEITASYDGDSGYLASTSAPVEHLVAAPTSIDLSISPDPAVSNLPVDITAFVVDDSDTPATGEVTFSIDGEEAGVVPVGVDGSATLNSSPLGAGTRTIEASFTSTQFGSSQTSIDIEVIAATTSATLELSTDQSVFSEPVQATITIESFEGSAPTGFVTINEGDALIATAALDSQGVAILTLDDLQVGTRTLSASYGGFGDFDPATSQEQTIEVSQAAVAVAVAAGDPRTAPNQRFEITIDADVVAPATAIVDGTVRITGNGNELATVELTNGSTTVELTTPDTLGEFSIVAEYLGTDQLLAATSEALVRSVNPAPTVTITPPATNTRLGDIAEFNVVVDGDRGPASGTVQLWNDDQLFAIEELVGGATTLGTGALPAGEHELVVRFLGSDNYAIAEATSTHQVTSATTTVEASANPSPAGQNQDIRVSALVIPDADRGPGRSGFMSFFADGELIAVAQVQSSGYAAITTSFPEARPYEITASFGGDSNYDASSSAPVVLDVLTPVVAAFDSTATEGTAPFQVTVDAGPTTGDETGYVWDFGDGTVDLEGDRQTTHIYTEPGIYSITLTATKETLRDFATERIVVVEDAPLTAEAGDDRNVQIDEELYFDGRLSTPDFGIDTFVWDFGDGTTQEGFIGRHTYRAPGDYVVTLTTFADGEIATDTANISVFAPELDSGLEVDVRSDSGTFIAGAQVVVIDQINGRFESLTDDQGSVTLEGLADTNYSVYAYAEGFQPGRADVTIIDGFAEVEVVIEEGEVGVAELETRRLTFDEIVDAGININDPANSEIVEMEIVLQFGDIETTAAPRTVRVNRDGDYVASEGCNDSLCTFEIPHTNFQASGRVVETADGGMTIWWMVIPVGASWLKEFFEAKLIVTNLSTPEFAFTQGAARLNLPAGLSLAPTPEPQSLLIEMDDVVGGESAEATWIIRGDEAGEYLLTADYTATLFPIGSSIAFEAVANEPIQVFGADALNFVVEADLEAEFDEEEGIFFPYRVQASLTNVSPIDVHGVTLNFERPGGENFIFQPDQQLLWQQSTLSPGESLTADLVVFPLNSGFLNVEDSFVSILDGTANLPSEIGLLDDVFDPSAFGAVGSGYGQVAVQWETNDSAEYIVYGLSLNDPSLGFQIVGSSTTGSWNGSGVPGEQVLFAVREIAPNDPDAVRDPTIHLAQIATIGDQSTSQIHLTGECIVNVDPTVTTLTAQFSDGRNDIQGAQIVRINPDGTQEVVAEAGPGDGQLSYDVEANATGALAGANVLVQPNGDVVQFVRYYARVWNDAETIFIPSENTGDVFDPNFAVPLDDAELGFTVDPVTGDLASSPIGDDQRSVPVFGQSNEVVAFEPCDSRQAIDILTDAQITGLAQGRGCSTEGLSGGWRDIPAVASGGICALDPIHPVTGNLILSAVDEEYPGAGITFRFDRSYNSTDDRVGPLGRGWTHNYDTGLEIDPTGDLITLRFGDGLRLPLFNVGVEVSGADRFQFPGGETFALSSPVGEVAFFVFFPDKRVFEFDESGNLLRMRDRNDEGVDLAYSGGVLRSVTDSAGRVSTFEYSNGRLATLTLNDGRTVSYGYEGDLLRTVTDTRGFVTEYRYDADGNMIEEIDQLGRRVHLTTYDETGRAIQQENSLGGVSTIDWDEATQTAVITEPTGAVTTMVVDQLLPVYAQDALGNESTYQYDPEGQLTSVTDALGRVTRFVYDENGNIIRRTTPGGLVQSSTYNDSANRTSSTNADGQQTNYAYDTIGRLISVTGEEGRNLTYDWDERGLLERSEDSLGNVSTFSYDDAANITQTCDALNRCVDSTYDSEGRVTTVTGPTGATVAFTYDAAGNRLTETGPLGRATTYTFDAVGNTTSITDAAGQVRTIAYNAFNQIVSERIGDNAPSRFEYDDSGRIVRQITPTGETFTYTYDLLDRVVGLKDDEGNRSRTEYDAVGNVIRTVDASGASTSYRYDRDNRLISVTNALGETTTSSYDGTGDVTQIVDDLGQVSTFEYDGQNRLVRANDPRGASSRLSYDAAGRLVSATDPEGGTVTNTYNAANELIATVEARGNQAGNNAAEFTTQYFYDAVGNLESIVDAQGQQTNSTFDPLGNPLSVTDSEGNRTTFSYDDVYRLSSVTAPDGTITSYEYDSVGDLVARTDARGNVTTYTFDDSHRLVTTTDPLNNTWTNTYDSLGRTRSTTDPLGRVTTVDYDERYLITSIDYSDVATPDVSFEYDALGRLVTMRDGEGVEVHEYDSIGRTTSITRNGQAFQYGYDPTGNITSRVYPDSSVVDYTYDLNSRNTSLTADGVTSTLTYDPSGLPTAGAIGNGVETTFEFDTLGRLEDWTALLAGEDFAYQRRSFDTVGNPLDEANEFGISNYSYDDRYRLIAEAGGSVGAAADYAYDENSNRVTRLREDGQEETLTYNVADRLVSRTIGATVESFTYDDTGNLLTDGEWTHTYDQLNRLIKSERTSDTTVTGNYRDLVLADDPVAYWPIVNGETETIASAVGGAPLDAPNNTAPLVQLDAPARIGRDGSYLFDGGDGRIDIEEPVDALLLNSEFTLEFWMLAEQAGAARSNLVQARIQGETNPWRVQLNTDGTLRFRREGTAGRTLLSSDDVVTTGEWVHVALRYNGDTLAWYINGDQSGLEEGVAFDDLDAADIDAIRLRPRVAMALDEFAIYDSAISESSIGRRSAGDQLFTYEDLVASDNPVAYLQMAEEHGSVVAFDASGNGNDGTIRSIRVPEAVTGAPLTGAESAALSFDGLDDRLRADDDPIYQLNDEFTVELWTRTDTIDDDGANLLRRGSTGTSSDGWRIRHIGDGALEYRRNGQRFATEPGVLSDEWAHVAVTYDGASLTWLVNGEIENSYVVDTPFVEVTEERNLVVGRGQHSGVEIDEIAFFDTALTEEQLAPRSAMPVGTEGTNITYSYDGNGLRRSKIVDGVETTYQWDLLYGLPEIAIEETEGETRRWVPGLGADRVTIDGEQYFTHQDALGSTVAVTDSNGALVLGYDYDAYGNVVATNQVDPDITGLERYGDGRLDEETGLYYLRARYYDPDLGIFTAVDPLDTVLGDPYQSRYSYVGGSPTRFNDPSGLRRFDSTVGHNSPLAEFSLFDPVGTLDDVAVAAAPPAYQDQLRGLFDGLYDLITDPHFALDVLGAVPGPIGAIADIANGALYLAEGNRVDAAISFGAVFVAGGAGLACLLYTSPSPRDRG